MSAYSEEILVLDFDSLTDVVQGMVKAHADEESHVFILAEPPEDPDAGRPGKGWTRYGDFLYPGELFASPETSAAELTERAEPALWGAMFVPERLVDMDSPDASGTVFTPQEFEEHITDLSSEHRESIAVKGRWHPDGTTGFYAPNSDEPGTDGAYRVGEFQISDSVLPGDTIRPLTSLNPVLFGTLIIPREVASEDAVNLADRGINLDVADPEGHPDCDMPECVGSPSDETHAVRDESRNVLDMCEGCLSDGWRGEVEVLD